MASWSPDVRNCRHFTTTDTLTEGASEALATASGFAQTQDITFPILVTPADPNRLQATAEALRAASADRMNGQLALAYMDGLFSMPEAQAAASWRSLALKPSIDTSVVANELAELRSATGVDILNEMMDVPGLHCTPISNRINKLYNAGTPALREHIKAIARKRGAEIPEATGTPIALD